MFREIRCCAPSCQALAVVGDGLVGNGNDELTESHASSLASQIGWSDCADPSHSAPCYRCPDHHE